MIVRASENVSIPIDANLPDSMKRVFVIFAEIDTNMSRAAIATSHGVHDIGLKEYEALYRMMGICLGRTSG